MLRVAIFSALVAMVLGTTTEAPPEPPADPSILLPKCSHNIPRKNGNVAAAWEAKFGDKELGDAPWYCSFTDEGMNSPQTIGECVDKYITCIDDWVKAEEAKHQPQQSQEIESQEEETPKAKRSEEAKPKCGGKAECLAGIADLTLADAKKDWEAMCELGAQCISEGVDACDEEALAECAGKIEVKWCAIEHDLYEQITRHKFQERLSEEDMAKLMDEVNKCTTEANDDSQEHLTALLCHQKVAKCVDKIKIDPATLKKKTAAAPEEPTRTFLSATVPEEAIEVKLGGCAVEEAKALCLAASANVTDIEVDGYMKTMCGHLDSCAVEVAEVAECSVEALSDCAMGKTEVEWCAVNYHFHELAIKQELAEGKLNEEGVATIKALWDKCWEDLNTRHGNQRLNALICQKEMGECVKWDSSIYITTTVAPANLRRKRAPSSPTYETTAAQPIYTTGEPMYTTGEPESTSQSYRKKRAPSFPATSTTSVYQTTTPTQSTVVPTTTKPIGFGKRAAVDFILWKRAPSSAAPEATTAQYGYSTQQPGYSTTSYYRKKRAPSPPTTAFPAATDGGYSTTSYYRKKRAPSTTTATTTTTTGAPTTQSIDEAIAEAETVLEKSFSVCSELAAECRQDLANVTGADPKAKVELMAMCDNIDKCMAAAPKSPNEACLESVGACVSKTTFFSSCSVLQLTKKVPGMSAAEFAAVEKCLDAAGGPHSLFECFDQTSKCMKKMPKQE